MSIALIVPATAGAATVGTTTVYRPDAHNRKGVAQAYRFVGQASGRVNRLNVFLDEASTANTVEIGLYRGSASAARRRRGRCVISNPVAGAWNRCSITARRVRAGARYWLALLQPTRSSGLMRYRAGRVSRAGGTSYLSKRTRLSALPATWRNDVRSGHRHRASLYADQDERPLPSSAPGGGKPQHRKCSDGKDNDNDGRIDMADAGCTSPSDNDETDPPAPPAIPPPTPTPTPTPAPSGFPDASNTGVPAGTTLTPSGGMTISTAGTVIDGKDISGSVTVDAPNVTIRRSRIRSDGFWVVRNNSTGLLIEDTELNGLSGNGTCLGSASFTLRRSNLHDCENGLDISGAGTATVEDNYMHDLDIDNAAHTDGIQLGQGAADIVIRHNTIRPHPAGADAGATSCIIMWDEVDPQNTRVWIEDNRLDGTGAAWTLYSPRQRAADIYINRNRMRPGVYGGYVNGVNVGVTVTEFAGNVDDVTGQPIS
jgi:hypothetical protein